MAKSKTATKKVAKKTAAKKTAAKPASAPASVVEQMTSGNAPLTPEQKRQARLEEAAKRKEAEEAAEENAADADGVREEIKNRANAPEVEQVVVSVEEATGKPAEDADNLEEADAMELHSADKTEQPAAKNVPMSNQVTEVFVEKETAPATAGKKGAKAAGKRKIVAPPVDEGDVQAMTVAKTHRDIQEEIEADEDDAIARARTMRDDKGKTPHTAPLTAIKPSGEVLDAKGTGMIAVRQAKFKGADMFFVYGPTGNLIRNYNAAVHGDMAEAFALQFAEKINGHVEYAEMDEDTKMIAERQAAGIIDADINTLEGRRRLGLSQDLSKNPDGTKMSDEDRKNLERAQVQAAARGLDRSRQVQADKAGGERKITR